MTLDARTLILLSELLAVLVGIPVLVAARLFPERIRRPLMLWGASLITGAAGLLLVEWHEAHRLPMLIALAHSVLVAGFALKADALRRLTGLGFSRTPYAIAAATIAINFVLGIALGTRAENLPWAVLSLACAVLLVHGATAVVRTIGRARSVGWQWSGRLVTALLAIHVMLLVARVAWLLSPFSTGMTVFSPDLGNQAFFLNGMVMVVMQTLAIGSMAVALELDDRAWANRRLALAFDAVGLSVWGFGQSAAIRPERPGELMTGIPFRPLEAFRTSVLAADLATLDALVKLRPDDSSVFRCEVRVVQEGGEPRWHSVYARRLENAGSHSKIVVATHDVHEERRAQLDARASAARLDSMLDAVGMVAWEGDPASGKLSIRGQAETLFDALPRNWRELRELIREDDREKFDATCARVLVDPSPQRCEVRIQSHGRFDRVALIHAVAVERVADGVLTIAGFINEVTELRHATAALQTTQEYLRRAVDAAGMVVWEWDADGGRRSFGDDLAIFGTRPASADDVMALIHPDDRARVGTKRRAALRDHTEYADEFRIVRADGSIRWLLSRGQPELDAKGETLRMSGVAWDITGRKEVEAALAETQERLRFALGAARMWGWELDIATRRRTVFGNDAEIVGASTESYDEYVGFVHPEDREAFVEGVRASASRGGPWMLEYRVLRPDGATVWLHSVGRTLVDSEGKSIRLIGVVIDISARKATELALADSARLLSLAAQAASLSLWTFDLGSQRFRGGDLHERFFGQRVETLPDLLAIAAGDDRSRLHAAFASASEGAETLSVYFRAGDGSERWYLLIGHVTRSSADGHGLAGVTREVTEEREHAQRLVAAVERERAASAAKSAFLATMSHELRTPLNGVIGCAELLAEYELAEQQRWLVETLSQSSRHLLGIINDILDYSKIEAGSLEVERVPMQLAQAVEAAVQSVASQAADRGLDLGMTIDGDGRRAVLGDPKKVQQVVTNFLSNAVKFTARGSVEVRLSMVERPGTRHVDACITVADTGTGIAADVLPALFQPFRQADSSTTREYGGTGLGLAIATRLARAMDGRIEAESELGRGSTFRFLLPCELADEQDADDSNHWLDRTVALRVQSAFVRRLLARQLSAWGASIQKPGATNCDVLIVDREHAGAAYASSRAAPSMLIELVAWGDSPLLDRTIAPSRIAPLHLPLRPTELWHAVEPPAPEPVPSEAARTVPDRELRLLIAEDNAVSAMVMEMMLAGLSCKADFVVTGEEAVERVRAGAYDVVLMDLEMPVLDGLEATRRIRERTGDARRPWIVAVTAHVLEGTLARIEEAGMNDYLAKPVRMEALREALYRAAGEIVVE